jgi:hypothetical protein
VVVEVDPELVEVDPELELACSVRNGLVVAKRR